MKSLSEVCRKKLSPRALGFDDAPFSTRPRIPGSEVHAVGIVTTDDRFEGMLYVDGIHQDGLNATTRITQSVTSSKFHPQIHAVLLDGVTMGGFNVIDIQNLANDVHRPVIALLRTPPDMSAVLQAVTRLPEAEERIESMKAAGPVHCVGKWVFQYRCPASGELDVSPEMVATFLDACTPQGTQKIAECLRIAHLIGAAIKTGQSSSSA